MSATPEIARENGRKGGRPKGSITKPKISDFITHLEFKTIMLKAKELAIAGDKDMIKFVGEQYMGKAAQSIDHTTGGEKLPTPLYNGSAK